MITIKEKIIMTISNKSTIVEVANAFTTHPDLDLGAEQGLHDFEGKLLADFEGSLTFNEYEINVSYNLALHEEVFILDITQELWLAEDEASIIVSYQNGEESVALIGAQQKGVVTAQYEDKRLMQITAQMPNKKYVFARDETHMNGIAPVFKPSVN
jgi:hypothetical protein